MRRLCVIRRNNKMNVLKKLYSEWRIMFTYSNYILGIKTLAIIILWLFELLIVFTVGYYVFKITSALSDISYVVGIAVLIPFLIGYLRKFIEHEFTKTVLEQSGQKLCLCGDWTHNQTGVCDTCEFTKEIK